MTLEHRTANRTSVLLTMSLVIGLAVGMVAPVVAGEPTYDEQIAAYRAAREARLRAPDGWLSLIGLFWLEQGDNRFGSDPQLPIVLPADAAPPVAGTFRNDGGTVRVLPAEGVAITIDGEPATERALRDDEDGQPDVVRLGRLSLYVIRRGERRAVRAKDPQAPSRTGFHGLDYYPVDPGFRVEARYEPFEHPKTVAISTVVGTVAEMLVPGKLILQLGGTTYELEPLLENPGDSELFIIFKDETSGTETYGAGRYLYAAFDGRTAVVDFNKAYNPPCAFTPFATCPLPPRSNRLPIAVRAGEKRYGEH